VEPQRGHPADFIGLKNYTSLFQDARFRLAVGRTFYFTLLAMAVEVVAGVAIALLLAREYPESGWSTRSFSYP